MKTDISVLFTVPRQAYKVLEMISEQNTQVDLYCMGGNEILLAANVVEFENENVLEDEDEDGLELFKKNVVLEDEAWEDIADFEDFPF